MGSGRSRGFDEFESLHSGGEIVYLASCPGLHHMNAREREGSTGSNKKNLGCFCGG